MTRDSPAGDQQVGRVGDAREDPRLDQAGRVGRDDATRLGQRRLFQRRLGHAVQEGEDREETVSCRREQGENGRSRNYWMFHLRAFIDP